MTDKSLNIGHPERDVKMSDPKKAQMAEQATGPKRRRRKAARPGEIIDAGLLEFAEHGFAGTRLEDVAARAGIVKGTIYRYFESKEALFRAAVRSRIAVTLDQVETLVDTYTGTTPDLLRLLLRAIYGRLVGTDASVLIRIIIAEGARFPEIPAYYHREMITKGEALLKKVIARGIASGEFRAGPAAEVPIVVVAPAIVAALWRMTFDPVQPLPPDKYFDAHIDLILNGLTADAA